MAKRIDTLTAEQTARFGALKFALPLANLKDRP